jgi:hypothetical protein
MDAWASRVTHFNYVTVLVLGGAILLVSMLARDQVGNTKGAKNEFKRSYSPPQSDWTATILRLNIRSTMHSNS